LAEFAAKNKVEQKLLPLLPRKDSLAFFFSGKTDEKLINSRKNALKSYLQSLVSQKIFMKSKLVMDFLEINA
jgi:PX domain